MITILVAENQVFSYHTFFPDGLPGNVTNIFENIRISRVYIPIRLQFVLF